MTNKKLDDSVIDAEDTIGLGLLKNHTHFLMGEIDDTNIEKAIRWLLYENMDNSNPDKTLTLYINSTGGSLTDAFGLIDVIKNSNFIVRTIAIGHFEELCQLGVQEPTSKASTNDGDVDINLPLPYSARACYRIYLKQLGYSATYSTTGATSVQWEGDEEDEKPKYMSATTYFTLWKSAFPHLKVSFVDIVAFS
jgi:hypothetical protein